MSLFSFLPFLAQPVKPRSLGQSSGERIRISPRRQEEDRLQSEGIGQMTFYLNYYREEMNTEGDTEPIGIILGAYQDKLVMRYALQNISNQVFVSRYQLYLPDRAQLEAEFRRYMGDNTI